MKQTGYFFAAAAIAVMVGFSSAANASVVASIDGITVTDYGTSTAGLPLVAQPAASISSGAVIETGQPSGTQSNPGWSPFGSADTLHTWWNIGEVNGEVDFARSGNTLYIVWGSPNDNNTVTFLNGLGTAIGDVTTQDLVNKFGVANTQNPGGYVIGFDLTSLGGFSKVDFTTGPTAFEFAFTAPVPEPSTWAMMILGFVGLGFMAYRRKQSGPAIRLV
jgi:hypothetical protein